MNTEANIVNKDGMTEFEEILGHKFTLYRNNDGTFQEKETTVSIVQVSWCLGVQCPAPSATRLSPFFALSPPRS